MNFTVTSKGRQYDRLGIMYLGDTEVWRTSTAEPLANGIIWTYVKEMQHYNSLWQTDQKIIFDLGNLVNDIYTGIFNCTLTATFFTVPDSPETADLILPISARKSSTDEPSVFNIPETVAQVAYSLPNNVKRAVASIAANGQSTEEFWYSNVFSSDVDTFSDSTGGLYGQGTWREVQLLIDGQLAGVVWPFPIIFTGGIVPGFWRPIVGINAYDLRENEIDLTPWLPLLADGASHTFEIKVASMNDDGAGHASVSDLPGSYWLVTGKIFLYFSDTEAVIVGKAPTISAPEPIFTISSSTTQNATGSNETLTYRTNTKRDFSVSNTVTTVSGKTRTASWTQSLTYENYNHFSSQGLVQLTTQSTEGSDHGSLNYAASYSYPLWVNSSYTTTPFLAINGTLDNGLNLQITGPTVFPTGLQNFDTSARSPSLITLAENQSHPFQSFPQKKLPSFSSSALKTTQKGTAQYQAATNSSFSFGTTAQGFLFTGFSASESTSTELYKRHVKAVNLTIVENEERLVGETVNGLRPEARTRPVRKGVELKGLRSVRAMLGRGPGGLAPGVDVGGGGRV